MNRSIVWGVLFYTLLLALMAAHFLWFSPWLLESPWYWVPALLGWLIILIVAFRFAYVEVPAAHKGIIKLLEYRFGSLDEGAHFIFPILMDVEPLLYEQKFTGFDLEVLSKVVKASKEKKGQRPIRIKVRGSFEWKPDPCPRLLKKFRELSEQAIVDGVRDEIKSRLEELAGQMEADDFISNRELLGLYINCLLRLQPDHPHVIVLKRELVRHYRQNIEGIKATLRAETDEEMVSDIEDRYGIDIIIARVSDVDYEESLKSAFEEQRRTEEALRGREAEKERIVAMTRDLQGLGVDANEAVDNAMTIVGKAAKQVVSIRTGAAGGALPLVIVQPPPKTT